MELPAYFISDAHLGIDPPGAVPDREQKLIQLLSSWKGSASHVVVVGDLFEFWYEYNYYIASAHFNLYRAFAELVESGVEAKDVIQAGEVKVNGEVDTRRGKKLVPGDTFTYKGKTVTVEARS